MVHGSKDGDGDIVILMLLARTGRLPSRPRGGWLGGNVRASII